MNFNSTINNTGVITEQGAEDSGDDEKIQTVVKTALMRGGSSIYSKGDKISINKGDFTGIKATVISIEDNQILFQAIGIPELTKHFPVDVSMVSKYFEPGDMVRIIEGKYQGETGQVIDVDEQKISMVLDSSEQEIKVLVNNLKLKNDTDSNLIAAMTSKPKGIQGQFNANDLVNFNNNRNIGLVLQVHEDYLKVIDNQNKLVNVKTSDIGKKISAMRPGAVISCRDSKGFNLAVDQVVRVTQGQYKGYTGPIRHFDKSYLFMWNKDFVQSNGIFVELCRNVEILGADFMKGEQGRAVGLQNKMVKDNLVGKTVVIIGGDFKGHRGRVYQADDRQAIVELSTKCKKLPIQRCFIQPIGEEEKQGNNEGGRSVYGGGQSMYGGHTNYDGGKTPMVNHGTPGYYPQS